MSEVNKSDWDTASNPIIGYADSYRQMARTGTTSIDVWSIITDLERNMAPLMTTAQSELAALREDLANCRESHESMRSDLTATEQRLADAERRNADQLKLIAGLVEYADNLLTDANNAWSYAGNTGNPETHKDDDYAAAVGLLAKPTESGASE